MGLIPSQDDPLEKETATHFSILDGKCQGQGTLVDYSPWGHKESDTTEHSTITHLSLSLSLSLSIYIYIYIVYGYYKRGNMQCEEFCTCFLSLISEGFPSP